MAGVVWVRKFAVASIQGRLAFNSYLHIYIYIIKI